MKYNQVLLIADVNIDILNVDRNSTYIYLIESLGFRILNSISTQNAARSTATTCTIIDHVISDLPNNLLSNPIQTIDISFSDHKALNTMCTIEHKKRNLINKV